MPIDPSIPLGIKVPDQTTQLSSLLTAGRSAQEIQSGGIALREKQALTQVMADPSNYTDEAGNIDTVKARKNILSVAPTTGIPVLQGLLTAQKQHTEAQSALSTLTDQDRTRVANTLSTLTPDSPPDVVNGTVDALDKAYGGRITPMVSLFKQGYANAVKQGPQAVSNLFATATRSVLPQTTQQDMNTPNGPIVSDGLTSHMVSTRPGTTVPTGQVVPGTEAAQLVPRSQQESVDSDAQGNKYVVSRSPQGVVLGTRPLDSVGAAPSPSPAPGPFRLPPGESQQTYDAFTNKRTAANNAAATVPDQQFNNNQIIKLAKTASLGQDYGGIVKGLTGHFVGLPGTAQGTVDYDKIEHFLALQQGTLANQAGFNSDASRSIADRQAGSAHGTAEGVTSIARTNRALATGADLYNRGNENAITSGGNNVFAQRKFQQDWSHTLDFDSLRLYDATKNRTQDPDGLKEIVKELGGADSTRYKAALGKIGAMRNLILGQ